MKVVTIGRNPDNNVVINDPIIGRHHLQIMQHDDGHFSVLDLNSKNGTFINGKRVYEEVELNPNDVIRVGRTTLPWSNYFGSTTRPSKKRNISKLLPIVFSTLIGVILILVMLFCGESSNGGNSNSSQYVDLGLPSGTKWKVKSESNSCTFAYAIRYYDGNLPTSGQLEELIENCKWTWTGGGYKVIGKNGESIFLSADFKQRGGDFFGAFWSKTKGEADGCFGLLCYPNGVKVDYTRKLDERSVILCCQE